MLRLSSSFQGLPYPLLVALWPVLIAFDLLQAAPAHLRVLLSSRRVVLGLLLTGYLHPLIALSFRLMSPRLVQFAHGHFRAAYGLLVAGSKPRLTSHLRKQLLLHYRLLLFGHLRASFRFFRFHSYHLRVSSRHLIVASLHPKSFLLLQRFFRLPSFVKYLSVPYHCQLISLPKPVAVHSLGPSSRGSLYSIFVNLDNEDVQLYRLRNQKSSLAPPQIHLDPRFQH